MSLKFINRLKSSTRIGKIGENGRFKSIRIKIWEIPWEVEEEGVSHFESSHRFLIPADMSVGY
jgi:hypothetical protein